MRKKILIFLSLMILSSFSFALSDYIISKFVLNGAEDSVGVSQQENKSSYKKVEFRDASNQLLKKLYLKNKEELSIMEAPYLFNDNGYYTWVDSSNNVVFNPVSGDNALSQTKEINQELILKPVINNVSTPTGNDFSSIGQITINGGRVNVSGGGNTYNFNEANNNCESGNVSTTEAAEITLNGGFYNDVNLSFNFKTDDGDFNNFVDYGGKILSECSKKYQANGDTTIALEDPTSEVSDYKPTAKDSGKNYCISRVKLGKDTIITNTSILDIGAFTSFYGGDDGYSQYNRQGFITGPYNELDLNGHTLIVSGEGSKLNAYGSIIDSSPRKTGKIIIENGALLNATFVVEDQHHESGSPMTYNYGGAFFSMFRCPYLNVPIIFKNGSNFIGSLRLDWGADNDSYSINDFHIIGSINPNDINSKNENIRPLINMYGSNNDSYIIRDISYDQELKNILKSDSDKVGYNNLLYQRITYSAYGCNISVQPPKCVIEMKFGDVSVDFSRSPFYVPPYFSIFINNCSITINSKINFYPGSFLNVDKNSVFTMSYAGESSFTGINTRTLGGHITTPDQYYSRIGGLNFIYEISDFRGDTYKYIDNSDVKGSFTGHTCSIFYNTRSFWKYMNSKHAYCNFDGKFEFEKIDNSSNKLPNYNSVSNSLKYELGGMINISNLSDFINRIENANDVLLYGKSFKSGPDRLTESTVKDYPLIGEITTHGVPSYRFNLTDYFISPLVSNGNVLFDVENKRFNKVRSDVLVRNISYDFATGIINSNNTFYGFFPLDGSNNYLDNELNHLLKAQYESYSDFYNGVDDLNGSYLKINYNNSTGVVTINSSENQVNFGGQNFIFYHGLFVKFNGTDSTINMNRFKVYNNAVTNEYKTAKFVPSNDNFYSHPVRRLS